MACVVAGPSPFGESMPTPHRSAEDFANDVSRLMEGVHEEVVALMQEGVQKTASFCASLCAERINAARREMQRRGAEERLELERMYGVPNASHGSHAFGHQHMRDAYAESFAGSAKGSLRAIPPSPPHQPTVSSYRAVALTPPTPQRIAPAPLLAQVKGTSWVPLHVVDGQQSETMAYDSTFIDAYDAVQSLEERTNMATRAMDLLDEALLAADASINSPLCARSPGRNPSCLATPQGDAASARSFASCTPQATGSPGQPWSTPQPADTPVKAAPDFEDRALNGNEDVRAQRDVVFQPDDPKVFAANSRKNSESPQPLPETNGARCLANGNARADADFSDMQSQDRGDHLRGRAVVRERSVASCTSGEISLAAADLHGT